MSECSLIKRLCASLINQMIIDWETHSLSSFQSTSSSTLQLSKSISWQVLLFCFMIIQILKHSWFVQFSTIIWFWIEIISLIKSLLAFDSCFKSESDLDQLSAHLLDQLLLTAAQICLLTIASDADIAFDHYLLQLTWRLTFWSTRRLSDCCFFD